MINSLKQTIQLIHVHPILLLLFFISFLTGSFTELVIIFSIISLHELGHYIAAAAFKWRISAIVLWAFGGVMKTDEHGNRPMQEEAIVILAGPVVQIFIYGVVYSGFSLGIIPEYYYGLILYYNTLILLFNLLPIWPLDGGKLIFLLLSSRLSFKQAYYMTVFISMILCGLCLVIQLFLFPFLLSGFLLWIFLFFENWREWKHRFYVFMRFLLRRYEAGNVVRGIQPIYVDSQETFLEVLARFHREKKHTIYIEFSERQRIAIEDNECLEYYFNEHAHQKTIGDAFLGYR